MWIQALIAIWLAIAVLLMVVVRREAASDRRRREKLFEFATARGWRYTRASPQLVRRWHGGPFEGGSNRRATNVVEGEHRGRHFVAFEYTYEAASQDDASDAEGQSYRFAVVAMATAAYLPTVQVVPETRVSRVKDAVTAEGIDLESEAFNRAFRVTARSPKHASDLLTARAMELLLTRPDIRLRVAGGDAITWRKGELTVTEIVAQLDLLGRFLDAVPGFIARDHGSVAP